MFYSYALYLIDVGIDFREFSFNFLFIGWSESQRETEEEREGGEEICCYTYLCVHWLSLVCILTGDQTQNLGV